MLPEQIKLNQKTNNLEVKYDRRTTFYFPCSILRAQAEFIETGQLPDIDDGVKINIIEPQGDEGLRFIFDDGYHQKGVYSWKDLYDLGVKDSY